MKQKINWKLLLIFGLLSSFIFQSCEKYPPTIEYIYIENYTYFNQTNYEITIQRWLNNIENRYVIPKSGKIEFKNVFGNGDCFIDNVSQTAFRPSWDCLLIHADSVKIIFDNNKQLTMKSGDTGNMNIFNQKNYTIKKVDNIQNLEYIFTQKEYELAK